MGAKRNASESLGIAALVAIAAATYIAYVVYTGVIAEDALITYRYVENLVAGHGLVFNPGEPVLGTTTPLYAAVLSAPAFLFGAARLPSISSVFMGVSLIASALVVQAALKEMRVSLFTRLIAVGLILFNPRVLLHTLGGMEMGLVVLLMSSSFLFLARGRFFWVAILGALLILTRIDGIVWLGLLFVGIWFQRGRFPFKELTVSAGLLCPWCIAATYYYGSFVPHSLLAKMVIPIRAASRLRMLEDSFVPFLERVNETLVYPFSVRPSLALASLALAALASMYIWRAKKPLLWLFPAFVIGYNVFLYVGHAPNMGWYLVPVYWCAAVFLAMGITESVEVVNRWCRHKGWSPGYAKAYGCAIVGVLSVLTGAVMISGFRYARTEQESNRSRLQIAQWLVQNTPATSSFAAEDVGYLGFYSRRVVVDLGGLNSPNVLQIARTSRSNGEVFRKVASQLHPDYIVLRSYEIPENRYFLGGPLFDTKEQEEAFFASYQEIRRFEQLPCGEWRANSCRVLYGRK